MIVISLMAVIIIGAVFALYNLLHYILFLLATHPKDAADIGHELNEFERRQLVDWRPTAEDFLKHDNEGRTYEEVFGRYRSEEANYSACVFPRMSFTAPYAADFVLLELRDGMQVLDLGCGSGAAGDYTRFDGARSAHAAPSASTIGFIIEGSFIRLINPRRTRPHPVSAGYGRIGPRGSVSSTSQRYALS